MIRLLCLAVFIGMLVRTAPAQDAAGWIEELRELRKAVEQQSKQIEALTQQVARLAGESHGKSAPTASDAPTASPATPAPEAAPPAPNVTTGTEEFATTNAPKAEAVPKHVVVKGETLTSIAKQYNVPLAELMKANKGLDARKLQIGQSILLPSASTTPAPSESKPNP